MEYNGVQVIKGTLRLLEIIVDGSLIDFEIALFGELGGFFAKLGNKKIEELEAIIEEITHQTHLELSRNFITPFDREDIHALVKSIDNVADNMHGAASRMRLYQVEKITKSIRKLTEINLEACQLIGVGIKELKVMNHRAIKENCKKINKLDLVINRLNKVCKNLYERELPKQHRIIAEISIKQPCPISPNITPNKNGKVTQV
jgi:uncharacterized protein Yka (UPF0111/DUF47 family)